MINKFQRVMKAAAKNWEKNREQKNAKRKPFKIFTLPFDNSIK